jgi:hypothetical protein
VGLLLSLRLRKFVIQEAVGMTSVGLWFAGLVVTVGLAFGMIQCVNMGDKTYYVESCAHWKPIAEQIDKMPPAVTAHDAEQRADFVGRAKHYCERAQAGE